MKTDDLIAAIAQDAAARPVPVGLRLAAAVALGAGIAAALLTATLGVRPDIASALQTWRFLLKVAIAAFCFAIAAWACVQLARPDADDRAVVRTLAAVPAALAAAVAFELVALPRQDWLVRAVGSNSRICLVAVPLLALAPLAALLAALRAGAPRSPPLAGAVAGLLAGGLAAILYASHCVDDFPLFVALWYIPAVAAVVALGTLAGRRVLRW